MSHKPTPKAVEDLLTEYEAHRENNSPNEHPCEGADFHSPRPLRVHLYRVSQNQIVWLCGTCADNIDTYVKLWEATGGLPWSVQRGFGNRARNLGNLVIAGRISVTSRRDS